MTDEALALRLKIMRSFAADGAPPVKFDGDESALLEELEAAHVVVLDNMGTSAWRTRSPATTPAHASTRAGDVVGQLRVGRLRHRRRAGPARHATVTSNGITVSADDPDPSVLFHVSIPAAHWWDDVELACSEMLLFRSEDEIDAWCRDHGRERGGVMSVDRLVPMAARWYGDRLDPDWRPHRLSRSARLCSPSSA